MQNAECKMQNAKFSAANRRDGTYGTNETYGVRSQTHHPLVPLVLLVSLVSYLFGAKNSSELFLRLDSEITKCVIQSSFFIG